MELARDATHEVKIPGDQAYTAVKKYVTRLASPLA